VIAPRRLIAPLGVPTGPPEVINRTGSSRREAEYHAEGFLVSGERPPANAKPAAATAARMAMIANEQITVPELTGTLVSYSLNIRSNDPEKPPNAFWPPNAYAPGLTVTNATYKLKPAQVNSIKHLDLPNTEDAQAAVLAFIKDPTAAPPGGATFVPE